MTHNLKLVIKYAKVIARARCCSQAFMLDLISEGNTGRFKAIHDYDIILGYTFATYSRHKIMQSIRKALVDQDSAIRLPVYLEEKRRRIHVQLRDAHLAGRTLSYTELAKLNKISERSVRELLKTNYRRPLSLDYPIGEDATFQYFVKGNEKDYGTNLKRNYILSMLSKLDEMEREIIMMRFGMGGAPMSLAAIGRVYGFTRENARQAIGKALGKLRRGEISDKLRDFL